VAMPMISEPDREHIRGLFAEKLSGDVTLELYTQKKSPILVPGREECQYCEETEQLLGEVADLSDRISLVVHDVKESPNPDVRDVPTLVYRGQNKGTLRFLGIPIGNEFRNLIDTIVEVGNGESGLSQETRDALAALTEDIHLRVFVTPT
jgi:alkyl hydroperoxide reductase subunit AhpF